MRVLVLGGTRFIGRYITERLVGRGDEVVVVHRGLGEPENWVRCGHIHVSRPQLHGVADRIREFAPDAVVDTLAMTGADAETALPHLPDVPIVLLSSMDVYRAYELALAGQSGVPLPIDETSAPRTGRYLQRGIAFELDGYDIDMDWCEKLDVEPLYLARGGTVLRLGMVYGEGDPQRREDAVLRRVRAGRRRIPIGEGNWLWTRIHVDGIASAVLAALDNPSVARGEVFNVGESTTVTFRDWIEQILGAAEYEAELVRVPADQLPADLALTAGFAQHLLYSSDKARRVLGWEPEDPASALPRSVRWHLANPPRTNGDFEADDRALEAAG